MGFVSHEWIIRLGCFVGVLSGMAIWELLAPRRQRSISRPIRWSSNLGLAALNTLASRLLLPAGIGGVALAAEQYRWGIFNTVELPGWIAIALSLVVLDLAIYLQHVLFHAVPLLWRLHMVHHADQDFDATTGIRFHTIEILLSLAFKSAVVLFMGVPTLAVVLFEVLLNITSVFNHGNVRLPPWLDRLMRLVVVTPEMHRVHHSIDRRESNSNFGFNLPWWDFLLGTYKGQPAEGHEGMTIGLAEIRDERKSARLPWILLLPFMGRVQSQSDGFTRSDAENVGKDRGA